jgi:hypothetical protein
MLKSGLVLEKNNIGRTHQAKDKSTQIWKNINILCYSETALAAKPWWWPNAAETCRRLNKKKSQSYIKDCIF